MGGSAGATAGVAAVVAVTAGAGGYERGWEGRVDGPPVGAVTMETLN